MSNSINSPFTTEQRRRHVWPAERCDAHLFSAVSRHCPPCAHGHGGPYTGGGGGGGGGGGDGASIVPSLLSTPQLAPTHGATQLRVHLRLVADVCKSRCRRAKASILLQ